MLKHVKANYYRVLSFSRMKKKTCFIPLETRRSDTRCNTAIVYKLNPIFITPPQSANQPSNQPHYMVWTRLVCTIGHQPRYYVCSVHSSTRLRSLFTHASFQNLSGSGHKFAKYDGKTNNFTDEADTLNCALAITPKYTLSKMHWIPWYLEYLHFVRMYVWKLL